MRASITEEQRQGNVPELYAKRIESGGREGERERGEGGSLSGRVQVLSQRGGGRLFIFPEQSLEIFEWV
jgi:hypothetical protein